MKASGFFKVLPLLLINNIFIDKITFCNYDSPESQVQVRGTVTCLAFCPNPENNVAASGTSKGAIALWDHGSLKVVCRCDEIYDGITV